VAPQPSSEPSGAPHDRLRVFYVSYDGVGEPLGRSQVLSYLTRLAGDHEITLFSFEKQDADRSALAAELAAHGIAWRSLSYHKRPPVLSTLLDVLTGVRALAAASRAGGRPDIVHVRSYVPALIAMWARRFTGGKLLFDIRGFWADERIEGGIWPQSRLPYRALYRIAKRCERWFFAEADAIVTLTHASVPQIRAWTGVRNVPIEVIPTCTDLERFAASERRQTGPQLLWCGSIGTWYRFDLAVALASFGNLRLDVVTRQTELAEAALHGHDATVRSLPPEEVPAAMHVGDVGLSLCVASFSKTASAPTRVAEYLAAGMAVIANPGIGDLEAIVHQHRVGVVLEGEDEQAITAALEQLKTLQADPGLPDRCRAVAHELFDVEAGSRRYAELYSRLTA